MEFLGYAVIGLIVLVIALGLWAVSAYNGFVKSRNLIQESWRQIDVELNRRYDLIPNLVETVRGYAAHERNTLEQITNLRNSARQLANEVHGEPTQDRAQVESQLTQAVRNLIVSVEAYPDLKSNVNFLELQRELTDTEDRIAAGRRFYNANVRAYNTRIDSVPSNFIANMAKFEKATYFEVNDPMIRQRPDVNFGEISDRPGSSALPNPQAQPGPYQMPSAQPEPQLDYQQQPQQQQTPPPNNQGGYQPPYSN